MIKHWPRLGVSLILAALLVAIDSTGAPWPVSLALLVFLTAIARLGYILRE